MTEAEIRSIVQEGAGRREAAGVQTKIMGRVFSLGDRTVGVVMTPPQQAGVDRRVDERRGGPA